jgi:two-component system, LytTR family, response regulator
MPDIRALIVDDEPHARARVRELLGGQADVMVTGECGNGREAIAAIRRDRPDLVFLDVQMPGIGGFGVLEALEPAQAPAVVFVTAFDEFAVRAFEVHALDYLLKPFDGPRFLRSLERARDAVRRRRAGQLDDRLAGLLARLDTGDRYLRRVLVKAGSRTVLLRTEEIDWLESAANYVRVHVGRERHLLRETMTALEDKLDPDRFVRIHRSTIVNLDRVRELEPYFHGDYVLRLADGTRLTLSRSYRDRVQERLGRAL